MKRHAAISVAIAIAAATAVGAAPQVRDPSPPARPGSGQPPGSPATTAATARVSGRVVSFDEPARPVGRAIVSVSSDQSRTRSTIANDDGTFVVDGLPAGRFTIRATRAGYLDGVYGAKQPLRAGTVVTIAAGERREGLTVRLARGAVITGTIRDEFGAPVAGLGVRAFKSTELATAGQVATSLSSGVVTDDRGVYRIFGLAPGSYVVIAGGRNLATSDVQVRSSDEIDAILAELRRGPSRTLDAATPGMASAQGPARRPTTPEPPKSSVAFAPVFYPGTPVAGDASAVTLAVGEERGGVDFTFAPTKTARVSGTIVNPSGPLPPLQLTLAGDAGAGTIPTMAASLQKAPGNDGTFVYTAVAPGRYQVMVRTNAVNPAGSTINAGALPVQTAGAGLFGIADVNVNGVDLENITITLQPSLHVTGRVAFDSVTLSPPTDLTRLRISMTVPNAGGSMTMNGVMTGRFGVPVVPAKADGTFDVPGVIPGTYQVSVSPAPDTKWWLRSVMAGTRDLLDQPLEITTADVTGIVATFTDRRTELSGRLVTPAGAPATDYVVIVFSADRAHWRPQARRLIATRPATDGQFVVKDLPAGDYFIAALTDLDPDAWQGAAFLDQVVPAAIRITLGEGEKKTQDLRIAR